MGLVLFFSAALAWAHDPCLSLGRFEIKASELVWVVALAPADAEWLLPLEQRGADASRFRALLGHRVPGLISLTGDGVALACTASNVEVLAGDRVEFRATFVRPSGQAVVAKLLMLPFLPSRHRHYMIVVTDNGTVVIERLMDARDAEVAIDVPPVAGVAAGKIAPPAGSVLPPESRAVESPKRLDSFVLFLKLGGSTSSPDTITSCSS